MPRANGPKGGTRRTWRRAATWLLVVAPAAAAAYLWIAPWGRPRRWRGDFLGGYYHLEDVYLAIPLTLAALLGVLCLMVPPERRRGTTVGAGAALVVGLGSLVTFDLFYVLVHRGAWRPAHWLDLEHVAHAHALADPELGFRRKPLLDGWGLTGDEERIVHYRTDARGFRNPATPTRADVVFVGDSYTEAAQVPLDENFVARVGMATGRTVANLGVGAYGPQQEVLVLEREALRLDPEVVVWQLFEGNDLGDAEAFAGWRAGEQSQPRPLLGRWVDNSFFRRFFLPTRERRHRILATLPEEGLEPLCLRVRYRVVPDLAERKAEGLALTLDALRQAAAACRARGVRLVVVFVPVMARVYASRLQFDDREQRRRVLPPDADLERSWGDAVAAACAASGCEYLDLLPVLQAAAERDPRDLFLPHDEHFGRAGHRVVAAAIVLRLREIAAADSRGARHSLAR